MTFNFDRPPDRRGTDSQKWQKYAGREILPMWVADMDFEASPAIVEALQRRVAHGIFGYARPVQSTVDAVVEEMARRHRWKIDPAWIVWLPGLVCGLNIASLALRRSGRRDPDPVSCLSALHDGAEEPGPGLKGRRPWRSTPMSRRWDIDWDALERRVTPADQGLLFLPSAQPGRPRLDAGGIGPRSAEFCLRHNLVLCSDDIHCDLLLSRGRSMCPSAVAAPGGVGAHGDPHGAEQDVQHPGPRASRSRSFRTRACARASPRRRPGSWLKSTLSATPPARRPTGTPEPGARPSSPTCARTATS